MNVESFVEEVRKDLVDIETLLKNAWRDECLNEHKLEMTMIRLRDLLNDFDSKKFVTKPPLTTSMKVCVVGVTIGMMVLYHFYWNFL
jgi:hypothetical protein